LDNIDYIMKHKTKKRDVFTKIIWIAAVVGFSVAVYLTISKLTHSQLYCTPGLGDCNKVNATRWSLLWGIPLAAYGAAMYAVILLIQLLKDRVKYIAKYEHLLLFGISLFGFLFSLYLTYLEIFVIKALCQWCVVSALSITVIFSVSIIRLVKSPANETHRRN